MEAAKDSALDLSGVVYPEEPYMLSPDTTPYGYFPMKLGEYLSGGQYKIVRKLGWETNATTWLAKERIMYKKDGSYRYAVIKIFTINTPDSEYKKFNNEHEVYHDTVFCYHLRGVDHPGIPHCAALTVLAIENSLHGEHFCVVYTPHGTSLYQLFQESPGLRLPLSVVKSITRQILLALNLLHGEGRKVHTDVQLSNILIKIDPNTELIDRYLAENPAQTYPPLPGIDILPIRSQPLPNLGLDSSYDNIQVGLADYRNAIRLDELDINTPFVTPSVLQAPEQLLGHEWSRPIDVWAVGCMVAELLTGKPLFDLPESGESAQAMHVAHIYELLGRFPREFVRRCTHGKDLLDDEGIPLRGSLSGAGSLERRFESSRPALSAQESRDACTFVRKCLAIDPQARPTVSELLTDAWLAP